MGTPYKGTPNKSLFWVSTALEPNVLLELVYCNNRIRERNQKSLKENSALDIFVDRKRISPLFGEK